MAVHRHTHWILRHTRHGMLLGDQVIVLPMVWSFSKGPLSIQYVTFMGGYMLMNSKVIGQLPSIHENTCLFISIQRFKSKYENIVL